MTVVAGMGGWVSLVCFWLGADKVVWDPWSVETGAWAPTSLFDSAKSSGGIWESAWYKSSSSVSEIPWWDSLLNDGVVVHALVDICYLAVAKII